MVYKFKKGNRISIKKENRGKFTDYCGGKVTDECILKGKHSSNEKIRKRAIFADNVRHFKHKSGGLIVQEFKWIHKGESGMNISNLINSDFGKAIIGMGSEILSNSLKRKRQNQFFKAAEDNINKEFEMKKFKIDNNDINRRAMEKLQLQQLLNPDLHYGLVDLLLLESNLRKEELAKAEQDAIDWKNLELLKLQQLRESIQGSGIGLEKLPELISLGIDYFKKPTNNSFLKISTNSSFKSPSISSYIEQHPVNNGIAKIRY